MLAKLAKIVPSECQVNAESVCLVGVSGGPDSMCLLHMLHRLGYPLIAVHVNHGLRPEADQEEQFVRTFAEGLGIEYLSRRVDVRGYAEVPSLSIEESARQVRDQGLFDEAEKTGAAAVLVAHNADDQVETILMHLLRGTGLSGLRGMDFRTLPNAWNERIPLIRPLISTWREEILAYLHEYNLAYIADQSNNDIVFFRNRIRHELLPDLEKYNPRIRQNLLRMSQINKDDYAVLQQLASSAWQAHFARQGPG